MLPQEQLDRINELARKEKNKGLTIKEKDEQKDLREKYVKAFRENMRSQIEGLKVVDGEGEDVTPEKLKKIQKDKGIHGR